MAWGAQNLFSTQVARGPPSSAARRGGRRGLRRAARPAARRRRERPRGYSGPPEAALALHDSGRDDVLVAKEQEGQRLRRHGRHAHGLPRTTTRRSPRGDRRARDDGRDDRLDELFAAPSVDLQLQRCPYYHFDSFKRHHYLTEGINKSCWSWELRLHGRPIGFHSVNTALGMPGAGEGSSGGSREHRVVILPDFQGIGLGWMLAETVAAQLTSTGRRYTSITMHSTFGKCRDRSPRWRPNARNHKADKDEATTDVRGRSLAQKAGTWAPTTRDKLRPSYRHEYVGDPGAERDAILRNLSDTTPRRNCKLVGCAHCTTNKAEFQKKLKLYKLSPTNELKGTCWVKGGPPALSVPRPPVSTLKREDRSVTKRLEAVKVEGGRGPRSKKDVEAEKKAKKDADLLHREAVKKFDTPVEFEGDWTKKRGSGSCPRKIGRTLGRTGR